MLWLDAGNILTGPLNRLKKVILYLIFGSLYFSLFYDATFTLYINGNGGFVGQYLSQGFFGNLINAGWLIR